MHGIMCHSLSASTVHLIGVGQLHLLFRPHPGPCTEWWVRKDLKSAWFDFLSNHVHMYLKDAMYLSVWMLLRTYVCVCMCIKWGSEIVYVFPECLYVCVCKCVYTCV
jgi:hypothetical protein